MYPAVAPPQIEPRREVSLFQSERKMPLWHRTGIAGGATGRSRPEIGDFFQVGRPVFNLRIKNRPDFPVLPHIGVELTQQLSETIALADPFEKRSC